MKRRTGGFAYRNLLAIALVFAVLAMILFLERSGVRGTIHKAELTPLRQEQIVTKDDAAAALSKDCLVLWDSTDVESVDAKTEFEVILTDMKVGHTFVDLAEASQYSFADYKTAVILLHDLSRMGSSVLSLCDWVNEGGGALFPLTLQKETYFSVIEAKLGISNSSYESTMVDSIYLEDGFMVGGGRAFEITDAWDSGMALQLLDDARVHVYATTNDMRRLPLVWKAEYGAGSFVVDNFGLCEKNMRGFFAASYSLLEPVFAWPVINGSAFYLDDFPSQIPSDFNEYIQRDYHISTREFYMNIWWPDMMRMADRYGLKYTGLVIETYDNRTDGVIEAKPDKSAFMNIGNMLLRKGGELGYHGYNHQPLCLGNVDYRGLFDYKTWPDEAAMKIGIDELRRFCDELFPDVPMSVYVPPSNILSEEGRAFLLREYPDIRAISGIYFTDEHSEYSCTQEFDVTQEGIVDQPRIISGCFLDPYMELAAISELNFHYVNSHFTHPDDALDPDRGAEMGWEKLIWHFNDFLSWLYTAAPQIRNLTGSEMSAAVEHFAALTVAAESQENKVILHLGNFYDEAQLLVRINEGEVESVAGGSLEKLTGSLYCLQAQEDTVTITLY